MQMATVVQEILFEAPLFTFRDSRSRLQFLASPNKYHLAIDLYLLWLRAFLAIYFGNFVASFLKWFVNFSIFEYSDEFFARWAVLKFLK